MMSEKKVNDIVQTILKHNPRLAAYFQWDKEEIKTYVLDMEKINEEEKKTWMNL